jgi:N-carbamoyl-L-amino-acid hydrolase
MMEVYPNSRNVIPGRVFVAIDIRHPDDEVLAQMDGTLRTGVERIARAIGLDYELEQIFYVKPVKFDEACVAAVRDGAEAFGYEARQIVSGAGHDACYMSKVAPTAMVFVPCIDGISHNEVEDAKPEWITAGGNVLLRAIVEKAGRTD